VWGTKVSRAKDGLRSSIQVDGAMACSSAHLVFQVMLDTEAVLNGS
jgi:hypothetical protein